MNRETTVRTAEPGTPCGFSSFYGSPVNHPTCASGRSAVHILLIDLPVGRVGTALCAYHSPFDPTAHELAYVALACTKPVGGDPVSGLVPCGRSASHVAVRHGDDWVSGTFWCADHVAADTKSSWMFRWVPLAEVPAGIMAERLDFEIALAAKPPARPDVPVIREASEPGETFVGTPAEAEARRRAAVNRNAAERGHEPIYGSTPAYSGRVRDVLASRIAESGTEAWTEVAVSAPSTSGELVELAIPHPAPGGGMAAVLNREQTAATIAALQAAGRALGWWE